MTTHDKRNGTTRRSVLRRLGIAGSAIALSTGSAAGTPATPSKEIVRHENLTYAERPDVDHEDHSDGELRLDLYLPDQRKPHPAPVVVYIHGGQWLYGDKADPAEVPMFEHFARQGFAVASIEYRFATEATFPAQIRDVNTAIRWLRARADDYGLDAENVATWGTSAGAHLAALAGVTNDVDEFEGDGPANHSSDVQAAVSWYGIMALDRMRETAHPDSPYEYEHDEAPESLLVGETVGENPETGRYASPLEYVTDDDPPLLLYHGNDDHIVGYGQSELLFERAREICHDTTFYELHGLGHSSGDVFSALGDSPPAEATARTVQCTPSDDGPRERVRDGPIASLTDMERFLRRNLRS
ncbi:alpha/beta hydrolase [Haloterrigena alkaliphila]|uniref:Alpha/beta hydrolase n=1 Tax=Haloterrigena alkaliphila TaxID=2816475 RepID=A0A8A2VB63_9EURY|nr:alpha/beta hydrolase [Haloterrigena alkaliphila]QSW97672.1 alpha/beta hydrolase [Haloterrigena alkaliphila]